MKHVVEPATVTIWIGRDCNSGQSAQLTISE